jgi:hypothetical protein
LVIVKHSREATKMDKFLKPSQTYLATDVVAVRACLQAFGEFTLEICVVAPREFKPACFQRELLKGSPESGSELSVPGKLVRGTEGVEGTVKGLLAGLLGGSKNEFALSPELLGVFERPAKKEFGGRRFPSLVYLTTIDPARTEFAGGVHFKPWESLLGRDAPDPKTLLFDHVKLLRALKEPIQKRFHSNDDLIRELLGDSLFGLGALQRMYQQLVGREFDRSNFTRVAETRLGVKKAQDKNGKQITGRVGYRSDVKLYRF